MSFSIQQSILGAFRVAIASIAVGLFVVPTYAWVAQENESGEASNEADQNAEIDDDPLGLRKLPDEAQDIGIDPQLGAVVDGDLLFHDSENRLVRLGDLFDGSHPVMLSFNYSNCPKLCSVQLENMTETLRKVDFEVGKDFDFVSVSIDPLEQTVRARENKEKYLHLYNRKDSAIGWHFLTGQQSNIAELTDLCGFRYKYVHEQKLYSHKPVFVLFSPTGKIVRYIHGIDYDPATIRLALIEAAAGKIGSPINWASYSLGCFSYNDSTGQYSFQAMALMRIGGLITIFGLVVGLVPYWFFHHRAAANKDKKQDSVAKPSTA